MFVSLWSLKGGAGCSVVAALTALQRASANDSGTLLVDLTGELSTVLGAPPSAGPGLAEWLRTGIDGPPDGLARLATEPAPGVSLVGPGLLDLPAGDPDDVLLRQIDLFPGTVIVDAGLVLGSSPRAGVARWFATRATRSVLVTRACYLALRRVAESPVTPSGVIVVREEGRALNAADITQAAGAPVVAEISYDPAIARAVDAGLLLARFPRSLRKVLGQVA